MNRLRRMWIPVLLQTAVALAACDDGDDGDDDDVVDSGTDAGKDGSTPPTDGGTDAAVVVKVSNVLATCSTASQCMGASPICQQSITLGAPPATVVTPFPDGGACSAECTVGAECGTGGVCPVGEAIKMFPQAGAALGGKGYCSKGCTPVGAIGSAGGCPGGYVCSSVKALGEAVDGGSALPIPNSHPWNTGFCLPFVLPRLDGGTSQLKIGGMDAGL